MSHLIVLAFTLTLLSSLLIPASSGATSQTLMADPSSTRLYFGYGSNLWRSQMALRCPESEYLGTARLDDWRWIINDRGYANVVARENESVWGMVYSLTASDEGKLDGNEGVPEVYEKRMERVVFWPTAEGQGERGLEKGDYKGKEVEMLVYIDFQRTEPAQPKKEYIYRMNRGVGDALKSGIPKEYVDGVIRKFIPDDGGEGDEEMRALAEKQAGHFEDESE